jgi:hypothetical protein
MNTGGPVESWPELSALQALIAASYRVLQGRAENLLQSAFWSHVGPSRIDGQAGLVRLVPRSDQCIARDGACIDRRARIDGQVCLVRLVFRNGRHFGYVTGDGVRIDGVRRRLTPGKFEGIGRPPTDRQRTFMKLFMVTRACGS